MEGQCPPHPPPVVRTIPNHRHYQCYCYPSRHSSASVPQPQSSHPGTRCSPPCMQRGGQKGSPSVPPHTEPRAKQILPAPFLTLSPHRRAFKKFFSARFLDWRLTCFSLFFSLSGVFAKLNCCWCILRTYRVDGDLVTREGISGRLSAGSSRETEKRGPDIEARSAGSPQGVEGKLCRDIFLPIPQTRHLHGVQKMLLPGRWANITARALLRLTSQDG